MTMTAERWTRIEELFHKALAADCGARDSLLATACAGDAELRSSIEALLSAHEADIPSLDRGPEHLVAVLETDPEPMAGRRIGTYRLVREIGRGGMGVVYLAERDESDFRQTVALKCLLPGVATPALVARFRQERRILASLVHPRIAQLHDGGVTDSGEPYLVMEFVEGEPIDRWCDRHSLPVEHRLRLFVEVCSAVQYAHEHLVVHRDLKPGNVLVTAGGDVKLLDFGIAKLLGDEAAADGAAPVTAPLLTPSYSSPEQVRGEPVTAASDVFSLGVILFELLTGCRAFTLEAGPLGILRAVVETEAPRASSVAANANGRAGATNVTDIAASRATTPARLARRLQGDLDTILARALSKEPSDRYASAQALLDDVRRHLDGLPIQAQPPSRRYRAAKFVRRHRAGVAAAVGVLLALVAGLAASLWQGQIAARERDVARAEANKARRVTDFLIDVFAAADPNEAPGKNLTAREILDRGANRIDAQLSSEPVIRATVQRAIGTIYRNLAEYARARSFLFASLERHQRELGSDHVEVADDLFELAELSRASGDTAREDSLYLRALEIHRRALGPHHRKVGLDLHGLALAVITDTVAADTLLRHALAIYQRDPGSKANVGGALNSLGFLHHRKGNYAEAERYYREALALQVDVLGEDHPTTLVTMSNLGWLLQVAWRLEAADSVLRRTLAGRRRILGDRHLRLAGTLRGLGEVANRRGAFTEAERYFTEALEISREHGVPATNLADNLQMLATVAASQGRHAEAHARYREAIDLLERGGLASSTAMARLLSNRGGLFVATGDYRAATNAYRGSFQLYREKAGEGHAFTGVVLGNLGSALLHQDSITTAEPLLRKAAETLARAYDSSHTAVGAVLIDLGTVEFRRGAHAQAERTLRRAVEILQAGLPAGHWRTAVAQARLGRCLHALRRDAEAEALLLKALAVLEPLGLTRARDRAEALLGLEEVYKALGRADDAQRHRARRLGGPSRWEG